MKILIGNGKICIHTTMGQGAEIFGEGWIIDEIDGIGLDTSAKMDREYRNTTKYRGVLH